MPQQTTDRLTQQIDRVLDWSQRHVEPEGGELGFCRMQRKSIDEDKRQIHFICSTGDIDRYGEIVEPSAYAGSIESFMFNPIFAAGHIYVGENGEPTIIGEWKKLWISDKGLEGIAEFDDEDPLAKRYWNLYRKGRMRAVSVGFIANAWEMREMKSGQENRHVRVFTDVDLLEISAVAIPANPHARVRSRSTSGGASNNNIDAVVEAAVERAIDKRFSTDPGGPMTLLAQDVAELVVAHVGRGADPYGDIPDQDDVPAPEPESEGEDHNLKAALLDVLGK